MLTEEDHDKIREAAKILLELAGKNLRELNQTLAELEPYPEYSVRVISLL